MGRNLISELVSAARARMQTQGELSLETLPDVADEIVDEFMRDGLITDDEDTEGIKAELISRLSEGLNKISEE